MILFYWLAAAVLMTCLSIPVYAFRAMGMEKRVDGAEDTHGIYTGICRTGRRSWVRNGVPCTQNDRFCMIDIKFTLYHFSA